MVGDFSHEIKRYFPLGKKAVTNLDSLLKSSDITLPTKVRLVKAIVFPVVMYGCESWTIKKAEHRRIDALELWYLEKTLESHLDSKEIKAILNEINPEYSLEGLMLKLKLQYFGHMMWRADSLEKTLMLGRIEDEEKGATENEMVGWHHQHNGHEFEQIPGDSKAQGSQACCSLWSHKELDTLSNWTTIGASAGVKANLQL